MIKMSVNFKAECKKRGVNYFLATEGTITFDKGYTPENEKEIAEEIANDWWAEISRVPNTQFEKKNICITINEKKYRFN